MNAREKILAAVPAKESLDLNPFGMPHEVIVRGLTTHEMDRMEAEYTDAKTGRALAGLRSFVCTLTALDPTTGEPIFTEEDLTALNAASGMAINAIFQKAMDLSKIDDDTIRRIAGNSDARPTD